VVTAASVHLAAADRPAAGADLASAVAFCESAASSGRCGSLCPALGSSCGLPGSQKDITVSTIFIKLPKFTRHHSCNLECNRRAKYSLKRQCQRPAGLIEELDAACRRRTVSTEQNELRRITAAGNQVCQK